MKHFGKVIKNKQFVYLWSSQILSQVTIHIINFLLLIKLFNKTGSTIATSFLWVAYALPAIVIGPFAAATADMVDRRKILMITNLLQSAIVFLYAFSHQTSLFLLYGIALSYSFLNQFYVPAEQAALPVIVKKDDLPQANGLFFLTQQAAVILGFGFAGILSSTLGFATSLYLGAAFLFFAFVSVSFLKVMRTKDKVPRSFEKAFEKFFKRIVEGYKYIKNNTNILAPFILLISMQITLAVVIVNIPLMAIEILDISVDISSLFVVVPAGIGAIAGSLVITKLLGSGWRKKRIIEISLMIITFLLFSYTFIIPEITSTVTKNFFGILFTVLAGLSFIGVVIPAQTFLQEKTPGGLRGRVFGNYWFLVTVATIFPVILSGTVSELFGVRTLLVLLAAVSLFGVYSFKNYGQKFLENGISLLNGGTKND